MWCIFVSIAVINVHFQLFQHPQTSPRGWQTRLYPNPHWRLRRGLPTTERTKYGFITCFYESWNYEFTIKNHEILVCFVCRSCHFDRVSNDEFSVECLFWFFQLTRKYDLKIVQITRNDLFWVNAPLYLECAPNCKTRPQFKKVTITNIWHSIPISTVDMN